MDEKIKKEDFCTRLNSSKNFKSTSNENYSSFSNRLISKQSNSTKNKDIFDFDKNDNSNMFTNINMNFKQNDNLNYYKNSFNKINNFAINYFSDDLNIDNENQNDIFKETVKTSFNPFIINHFNENKQ
jgi:hypothetical protein